MGKIVLIISLDVLKFKIEKSLHQFGLNDTLTVGGQMLTLSLTKLTQDEVDLIIIDIDNPDHDAMDIIRKLKSSNKTKRIPLVAIGNANDKATLNKVISSGCIEYFNKPLDDIEFVGKIHNLINEFNLNRTKSDPRNPKVDFQQNSQEKAFVDEAILIDMKFTWNPIFESGIEFIDQDHMKIIEEYEKLYHLMKFGNGHDYCEELLAFLEKYIDTHFVAEERYMNDIEYPEKEEHIAKHRFFTSKIISLRETLVFPVSSDELIKINLFIKEWLIQHIIFEDQKMVTYAKEIHLDKA